MEWLWIIIFIYVDMLEHPICHVWIHFFILPPYTREKNHLDNAGIVPGSPAPQASTLSITPSPRGVYYARYFDTNSSFNANVKIARMVISIEDVGDQE